MKLNNKRLLLLPLPISDDHLDLPESTLSAIRSCDVFICERVRTFRRLVKQFDHPTTIDDMTLIEMDKHDADTNPKVLQDLFSKHDMIGVVSEAGCPGVADPGYRYVRWAHEHDVIVQSFIGPSSILLALMSSGFSGQKFTFHGYLDAKRPLLTKDLYRLEKECHKSKASQIFIEAPYRNMQVMETALTVLSPKTLLHVSCDLRTSTEYSCTKSIAEWKKVPLPQLHKRPAIFIIGVN